MTLTETQIPSLRPFTTLTETAKANNIDYCSHLICSVQSPQNQQIHYVIFTGKLGHICIVVLEEGCIVGKSVVEIVYAYSWRITCLVAERRVGGEDGGKLGRGVYLFVGFEDGSISMHMLIQNSTTKPLTQIFKTKPKSLHQKKQPVITTKILGTSLLLVTAYNLYLYKNIFKKQQKDQKKTGVLARNAALNEQQEIPFEGNSCKLNAEFDESCGCLWVFNQFQGAGCLGVGDWKVGRKIQDSIKVMKLLGKNGGNGTKKYEDTLLLIGSTDNSLKIIDYSTNIVTTYKGLKNYPTCIHHDPQTNLIWLSSLDGSISCFRPVSLAPQTSPLSPSVSLSPASQPQPHPHPQSKKQDTTFTMFQKQLKYRTCINQNGIKKIMVCGGVLVVFDTCHNVEFYDILGGGYADGDGNGDGGSSYGGDSESDQEEEGDGHGESEEQSSDR